MVNLRSRIKARAAAPRAASRTEVTVPLPNTMSDDLDLSEAALRKHPRSELQKLAMAHKVRANTKSEIIIRQMSSLQIPKTRKRSTEDDLEEGPSRKRFKREAATENVSISLGNQIALLSGAKPNQDTSVHTSTEDPQVPELGRSVQRLIFPQHKLPTIDSCDQDIFSDTESEMTEEVQLDYATPVSSRAKTPPAANVDDLRRCVKIIQEISAQDVTLLGQVPGIRETALKLRNKARDVRDLVKAERGRRVRMEAYLRHWQQICPSWDRQWLYGEKAQLNNKDKNRSAEPPNLPESPVAQQPAAAVPGRKPALSPEELKQRRQAIVAKQEAEQRQLEALRRREMRGDNPAEDQSYEAAEECT